MKVLYENVKEARFLERPNRFVAKLELDGREINAHMPNPGRMWELLFKGVVMYVIPHKGENLKTAYRVIGVKREGVPIMLDTNYCNEVAAHLVDTKQVPGWEKWHVKRREYTVGKSRFDLLLENDQEEQFLVEVKSCTLFSKQGAMFPDAITERGRKHLLHLAHLREEGWRTGLLFLVHWEQAKWFLPDYHTDLAFAKTFLEVEKQIDWKALTLKWSEEFTMPEAKGLCAFHRELLAQEAEDKGDYLMVLRLEDEATLSIGSKGELFFPKGFYVYVGSAKANLAKRMERHKRKRKKMHWHLDYLRGHCEVVAAMPIRTSEDLECPLAEAVKAVSDWAIKGFGCSDCHCESHLFGFSNNPVHDEAFMMVVEDFRMNILDRKMECL